MRVVSTFLLQFDQPHYILLLISRAVLQLILTAGLNQKSGRFYNSSTLHILYDTQLHV